MKQEDIKEVLDKHRKWLKSEVGGVRANLSYADLRSADLSSVNLSYADLSSADLRSADLRSANLSYADLRSANLNITDNHFNKIHSYSKNCPEEGDFIAWKVVYSNIGAVILKLLVTGNRVSPISGRKCRTNEVKVLAAFKDDSELKSGVFYSGHDNNFTYKIGETVKEQEYDPNPLIECSKGIHFFITRQEAEDYGR